MSFIKFGVFGPLFLPTIPVPLSLFSFYTPTRHTLVHLMVSQRSLRFCSLFSNLFSFYSTDLIISIVISPTTYSNLFLNTSSEFFISVVLFSSRIYFWILFVFSITLLIFPFCLFMDLLDLSTSSISSKASLGQLF